MLGCATLTLPLKRLRKLLAIVDSFPMQPETDKHSGQTEFPSVHRRLL